MWKFPKIVIVSKDLINEIRGLRYTEQSFKKFDDPTDPLYEDYKDRTNEKWHDIGHNNGIDAVLQVIYKRFL